MCNMVFNKANISIKEAANALGMDRQTVRLLIQTGAVGWGQAVKLPGSRKWFYIISPKLFYEETGVVLGCQWPDDFDIWEQAQTKHSDDADFARYCQKQMDEADTRQDAEWGGRAE